MNALRLRDSQPQDAFGEDMHDLGELVVERFLMISAHGDSPRCRSRANRWWEPDEPQAKTDLEQASSDAHHEVRLLRRSRSLTMKAYWPSVN